MKKRDRIGYVLYGFYLCLLLLSVVIIAKIIWLQVFFKPDSTIAQKVTASVEKTSIEPARGNILDCKGRLLAMSYPMFGISMDCTVLKKDIEERKKLDLGKAKTEEERVKAMEKAAKSEKEWMDKARELSVELPKYFPEKTAEQYYKMISEAREKGKSYISIGHPVDWKTCKEIEKLPLFRDGQFKGGIIEKTQYVRKYPYGSLARRTIGFVRYNRPDLENTHVGIEGKFDAVLHGQNGTMYLRKTDGGKMIETDSAYVKPIDGKDIRTTINIDYQEIADRALREQIEPEDDIEGACLILMETRTGAIRAMVNLVKDPKTGRFEESQNLAIGRKCEPGSVFKTVTLLSVLNDGKISSLEKTLPATTGKIGGTDITDDHIPDYARKHHTDRISVIDGFKISSNYVFAKLAIDGYGADPMKFIENIYTYKLGETFDFDLEGMASPYIPNPQQMDRWNNSDLGRVGFGYMTEETPIHIITFYNAIANKGRMMKPYLVEDIEKDGRASDSWGPSELSGAICTRAVADTMTRALRAVSEDGTARNSLRGVKCSVAGKTGTSFSTFQTGVKKDGKKKVEYKSTDGKRKRNGTFVAFFPADGDKDPVYSIICTAYSSPTTKPYQGGGIPARVTKNVINSLYDIDPYFRDEIHRKRK